MHRGGGGRGRAVVVSRAGCFAIAIAGVVAMTGASADSTAVLQVGQFSSATAGGPYPPPWKPLTFKKVEKPTVYSLVEDRGGVVLQAESRDAASGLTREVAIDPAQYPVVEWRWKVANVLANGDVTKKSGDDYAARLYITFAYDAGKAGFFEKAKYNAARLLYGQYPPSGAINYIWANKSPVGTRVANPYTRRVQMIVVQSGAEKTGQWLTESRNIYQDYRAAFGKEPPMISGVAVMTDTDNTHESALAWFGDIVFKPSAE